MSWKRSVGRFSLIETALAILPVAVPGFMEVERRNVMKGRNGFTLIEVLVAVTILAIGLLSIATMQITAIRANSKANTLSVASSLAQGVMEELMAKDNDDPLFSVDAADVVWDLDTDDAGETELTINGAGTYGATCTIDADNPVTNVARIDVVVTNGIRTVTLTGFKRAI